MASPNEKLAQSLAALKAVQDGGRVAIRSADLTRTHRERLVGHGFLAEVMKGWYIPTRPDVRPGDTTAWYASYWEFCRDYLPSRFGEEWCLSPEQSLSLHAGNRTVPRQLVVRAPHARNRATPLLHDTSLLDVRANLPQPQERRVLDGLRVFSVESALIASSPAVFTTNSTDVRTALSTIVDASNLLEGLLRGEHSVIAGRLAGALRDIGRERVADEIVAAMETAGFTVREHDPFDHDIDLRLTSRAPSPHAQRVRVMWQTLRPAVIAHFPKAPGRPRKPDRYLRRVDETYVTDAYHSLSIEGYRVGAELIERVRSGAWDPDSTEVDRAHDDALAARGYWQAFQTVKASVASVLARENPGIVADRDHGKWFRELLAPRVAAGLIPAASLAGYRSDQVFIRGSRHVPPTSTAVRDSMPVLFELLAQEPEPSARVVLGHFLFGYIHPYMDGNGRIGRFLMNVMLASGGYPWTVVPLQRRTPYLRALETASVNQDIVPFTKFLATLVQDAMTGEAPPAAPET